MLAICNGFQIACEAGLLPGALVRNAGLTFLGRSVRVRVESTDTAFTNAYAPGQVLRLPIAHGEGRFVADPQVIDELEGEGRVVMRYVDAAGEPTPEGNPNGSMHNIAGIINAAGNVLGLMPHPERAADSLLGAPDGWPMFESSGRSRGGLTHGGALAHSRERRQLSGAIAADRRWRARR